MSLIRGTSLQGFPELVTELGGDAAGLLAAAQVPLAAVGNQDSFISYRGVIAAVESAAVATSTPDFGRQLALRQGLEILGPVGVAVRTAPTVGAALQAADQYMSVYCPALSTTVDPQPAERHARFIWRLLDERTPSHRQAAELGLGVAVQVFRLLVGPDFRPVTVHFPHEPLTSPKDYVRYFGCSVRFSSSYVGFLVRRADLARPLSSDSAVHEVVRGYLGSITPPAGGSTVEPVRLLIRRMLPTGGLEIDLVAAQLALHPRTLQRHLAAQGTSFASLVDEVRQSETARYLAETDVALGQLAGILGYSEQSVLSRSCQRWFGMSASAYRRQLMT
jgi:AraC-like DNA-binding protein